MVLSSRFIMSSLRNLLMTTQHSVLPPSPPPPSLSLLREGPSQVIRYPPVTYKGMNNGWPWLQLLTSSSLSSLSSSSSSSSSRTKEVVHVTKALSKFPSLFMSKSLGFPPAFGTHLDALKLWTVRLLLGRRKARVLPERMAPNDGFWVRATGPGTGCSLT